MGIEDYDPVRDNNKEIPPGDITISADPLRRDMQIIDAIRQIMADLATWVGGSGDPTYDDVIADTLRLTSTGDISSLTSSIHALQLGPSNGQHLALDTNEIQSRNNGATAPLILQDLGGNTIFNGNGGGIVDFQGGQLRFPATQIPSSGVNDLDDFEENVWTPELTYATPGDLSVVYGTQLGRYQKVGKFVKLDFILSTTTHTFGTATGDLRITGLPFASANVSAFQWTNAIEWAGITTTRSQLNASIINNVSHIRFVTCGSALARQVVQATTNTTSGTQITLIGHIEYEAAN